MKKSVFIKKVQKELDAIKEKATPEELKKLVFNQFEYTKVDGCIYGLLTGDSYSERAKQFQKKTLDDVGWNRFQKFEDRVFTEGKHFTNLEQYLYFVKANTHREIFRYLKGKIEVINLNKI